MWVLCSKLLQALAFLVCWVMLQSDRRERPCVISLRLDGYDFWKELYYAGAGSLDMPGHVCQRFV